jgi:TRAP-type C4-dicarboxylate transport system permease small subunit
MAISRNIETLSARLALASMWLSAATATVMIATLLLGVFFRYVLQSALSWSGEVAMLAFTWTVFVMASVGVREGFHVRIEMIDDYLPATAKLLLHRLLLIAIGLFCLSLVVIGWQFVELGAQLRSPAAGYPIWIRNAALPIMASLGFVHVLARFLDGSSLELPRQS